MVYLWIKCYNIINWKGSGHVFKVISFASTTKSNSENGIVIEEGIESLEKDDYSFLDIKKKLLNLIKASGTRKEVTEYLYKVESIEKYLKHLSVNVGRKGKKYKKK